MGKPVVLTVRLTNHTSQKVRVLDSRDYHPFFSFDVVGPTGKPVVLKATWDEGLHRMLPRLPTIGPDGIYQARIDIADWYDLSQVGRYSIRAKWRVSAERPTDVRESRTAIIAMVPPEQAEVVTLIHGATYPTANGASEHRAQRKLVEMGEQVVAAVVQWLEIAESNEDLNSNSFADMVDVLSQIGSPRAREFLTPERAHGSILRFEECRTARLKRIEIWQSQDRFARLIAALDEPRLGRKWAIYKLGVLGDARAIGPLERIAVEDDVMDIRETAKDALAHLRDPNVPMRYVDHLRSQTLELTAAESYRVGEPVRVRCRITGGQYGSPTLVEFSKPNRHFLPWGFAGPDPNWSPPFGLTVDRRRDGAYDKVHPVRQLRLRTGDIAGGHAELYEDFVDVAELGRAGTFTLKPGESRLYEFADIRRAFRMTGPGEYRIHVSSFNYALSEFVTIHIYPPASGSASAP